MYPLVFIIVKICPLHAGSLKELHKNGGLKSKDYVKNIRHPPTHPPHFLRNNLRFPCMQQVKSNDNKNKGKSNFTLKIGDSQKIHFLFQSLLTLSCFLARLKQCLSVFFEHYPSLSANHKASNFHR